MFMWSASIDKYILSKSTLPYLQKFIKSIIYAKYFCSPMASKTGRLVICDVFDSRYMDVVNMGLSRTSKETN